VSENRRKNHIAAKFSCLFLPVKASESRPWPWQLCQSAVFISFLKAKSAAALMGRACFFRPVFFGAQVN